MSDLSDYITRAFQMAGKEIQPELVDRLANALEEIYLVYGASVDIDKLLQVIIYSDPKLVEE
jgi:hypothetical protein